MRGDLTMAKMGATVRGTKVGNGRGNPKHNMRDFTEEEKQHPDQANIDFNRTELNIIIKRETFEEAYNREFENVWDRYADERRKAYELKLEKYEAGQVKRKPRPSEHAPLKETPWEKYSNDGNSQTHLEMEYIFHVGGHADFNTEYTDNQRKNIPTGLSKEECDARWEKANDILKDFCAHIEKKYPKMVGVQIDLHNDEGYPHVHWRGFFRADGNTFKQAGNSPYRALKEMGVHLPPKLPESQYKAIFSDILRDDLDEVMKNHGWEREHKLTSGTRKLEVFQQLEEAQLELESVRREIDHEKRVLEDAKLKTKGEFQKQHLIAHNIIKDPDFEKLKPNLEKHKEYDPTIEMKFKSAKIKGEDRIVLGKQVTKQTVVIDKTEFDDFKHLLDEKNRDNKTFNKIVIDALENEQKQKYNITKLAQKPFKAIQQNINDVELSIKNEKIQSLESEIEQLKSENKTLKSKIQGFVMQFEHEEKVDKQNKQIKSENHTLKEENKQLKKENDLLTEISLYVYRFSKEHKEKIPLLKHIETYLEDKGIKDIEERRIKQEEERIKQRNDFISLVDAKTFDMIYTTAYYESPNQETYLQNKTWYDVINRVENNDFEITQPTLDKLKSHPYHDAYIEEYKEKKPYLTYKEPEKVLREIIIENAAVIKNDIRHNNIQITKHDWISSQRQFGITEAQLNHPPRIINKRHEIIR